MDADIHAGDLEGAWQLRSWCIHYPDDRPPGCPFGDDPLGLLLYSPDGWMSATVHRAAREGFPAGAGPRQIDDGLVAAAYRSFFHYAGTWRIEGDCVIHSVRHSLNPAMVGTEQVRRIALESPRLTLIGIEPIGGSERRHELIWIRAQVN